MLPATLEWLDGALRIVDQRALPNALIFWDCRTIDEVAEAIRTLAVRGAPAIGIAAAYGVALGACTGHETPEALGQVIKALASTRPTAVNLFWALNRMEKRVRDFEHGHACRESRSIAEALLEEAKAIHSEDIENNRKMGAFGQTLLPQEGVILTHCNAGALATGGHGTALGVLRSAKEAGKKLKVYADETRPLLQGARLTAWELEQDGFDVTVISDSMAAFLMAHRRVDAVIVGADRIAANGDVANKIGTYGLAIAAQHHRVPFYVAAPRSTFDLSLASGELIPIEERSSEEVRVLPGEKRVPDSIEVWNPSFDVTPAEFITAIITEEGIFKPGAFH